MSRRRGLRGREGRREGVNCIYTERHIVWLIGGQDCLERVFLVSRPPGGES